MRHHSLLCLALWTLSMACIPATAGAQAEKDAGLVAAYLSWSPNALHLAVRVEDPMVVGNQVLPMSQPWLDDAVAIYLNLDPRQDAALTDACVRIVISAAGGATVQRAEQGEWRDDPSWFQPSAAGTIRYGTRVRGKLNDNAEPDQGYDVELALAWPLLRAQPPIRQRPTDPLPAIGLALACYAQGETRSVSHWPPALTDEGLARPARWGRVQFLQMSQPRATQDTTAYATLAQLSPLIDGKVEGPEWVMAGVVTFPRQWGEEGTVETVERPAISVLAAWYQLAPPEIASAQQPLTPPGPWLTPESPLYHLQQIEQAREAGIDALAVVLPFAPDETDRDRVRALVRALEQYEAATSAAYTRNVPLLMPVVDLAAQDPAPAEETALQVDACLDTFYGLVPPQFRLTLPDAARRPCYPVLVTAPPAGASFAGLRGGPLVDGMPVGWLLDKALRTEKEFPGILSRCDWQPLAGSQVGEGPLSLMMVAPGVSASRRAYLPRRDGEVYENGWMKIHAARPDVVLVRSWNDFREGSQIAPSREHGHRYVDGTKVAAIRQAGPRGFFVRVLGHTLPPALRPGVTYPVEVLLKNGSLGTLITSEGCRVDYRILHEGKSVASGVATEQILLLPLSSARIRFSLSTALSRRHALPEGDYELRLDFLRNKMPSLNLPLMARTLGAVTIPFTVAKDDAPGAQLLARQLPKDFLRGERLPVTLELRNLGPRPWRKGKAFVEAVLLTDGTPGPKATLFCDRTVEPGGVGTFTGELHGSPPPGVHRLAFVLKDGDVDIPLSDARVPVRDAEACAHFLSIGLPGEIRDGEARVETPIALRNAGATAWKAEETRVLYQWLTWDGRPIPGAAGAANLAENVKGGGATTLRMAVEPPPGAGSFRCAFTLEHRGRPALLAGDPLRPAPPVVPVAVRASRCVFVGLKDAFNDSAAQGLAFMRRTDLDGYGNTFPLEELLPDMTNPPLGYHPGYYLAPSSLVAPFRFSPAQQGVAPVLRAKGQEIPLPEQQAAALHLAATRTRQSGPAAVTIRYRDGSEQQLPVHISNWLGEPAFGEPTLVRTRYVRTRQGDEWLLRGSIFAYRLPLDPARAVAAIVLPGAPDICIFAMTLELPEAPAVPSAHIHQEVAE